MVPILHSPPRSGNVVHFPRVVSKPPTATGAEWRALTHTLVMEKHRRGELDPRVVEYLLAGVGLQP